MALNSTDCDGQFVLLLSGPKAVGKTSLSLELQALGFQKLSTSAYLKAVAAERGVEVNTESLQNLGDELDLATSFNWVVDEVALPQITRGDRSRWLLDSVRKKEQVRLFRQAFGSRAVFHLHLVAPEDVLRFRYQERSAMGQGAAGPIETLDYDSVIAHPNEVASRSLVEIADEVIDVSVVDVSRVATVVIEEAIARGAL